MVSPSRSGLPIYPKTLSRELGDPPGMTYFVAWEAAMRGIMGFGEPAKIGPSTIFMSLCASVCLRGALMLFCEQELGGF